MRVSLQMILEEANRGDYAVPAFNVYNLETLIGVKEAVQETKSPVIFQVFCRLFNSEYARLLAPCIMEVIDKLDTPAVFHMDHGPDITHVQRALRFGVTGVMFDGSKLPYEENVKATKTAVELCSACDIPVEGELGYVGSAKDSVMSEYTKVDEAAYFVQETGVCALAVMVGTAHGRYLQAPKLDNGRISEIKAATGIPLVLHGGSGVPDDQIRSSIKAGIRKVNFATDLCYSFLDSMRTVSSDIYPIDLFMQEPIAAVKKFAMDKIRLLGAAENG